MTLEVLQVIWFVLITILVVGYSILAGFDLGVGNLHLLFNQGIREKNYYAVGPFWDSNQVWLITAGGAIFAAFPMVYATVFSGFYLAFVLLLLALIFRSVAIELHHEFVSHTWKRIWDLSFGVGSIVASILFGVALGNILKGIPLDKGYNYAGSFFELLNPYSITIGLLSLTVVTLQGASYLLLQGIAFKKVKKWAEIIWKILVIIYGICTVWSFIGIPRLFNNYFDFPVLFLLPLVAVLSLLIYPFTLKEEKNWLPILVSSLTLIGLIGTAAISLFPYLIPATKVANSLTIFNASSTYKTLFAMMLIAATGVPVVVFYTTYVYRKFIR